MWNRSKEKEAAECPDPFKYKVKCEECKHYIDKKDSSVVLITGMYFVDVKQFYCPMHKKPYQEAYMFGIPHKYYARVEVDPDGTPVGYKRIKEKE